MFAGFSVLDLAKLQACAEAFFDSTCDITNITIGPVSVKGGTSLVPSQGPQNVPCLARPAQRLPLENSEGGAQESRKHFQVLLKLGTAVSVSSRLKVTRTSTGQVENYEVIGHDIGRDNAQTVCCDCIRLNDGEY